MRPETFRDQNGNLVAVVQVDEITTELLDDIAACLSEDVDVLEIMTRDDTTALPAGPRSIAEALPLALTDALFCDVAGVNLRFVREVTWAYLTATEEEQRDMMAFVDSSGPERIRQLKLRRADGTPTAADLESAFRRT